jgi:hypothetical protein
MFGSIDRGRRADLPKPKHSLIFFLFVVHRMLLHVLVNHVDSASLDCTRKGTTSWHADCA